jgi:hypothetical protein
VAPLLSGILRGESEGVRPLYRRSEIGTPELKIVGEEGQLGEGRRARALGVEGVDAQVRRGAHSFLHCFIHSASEALASCPAFRWPFVPAVLPSPGELLSIHLMRGRRHHLMQPQARRRESRGSTSAQMRHHSVLRRLESRVSWLRACLPV